MILPFARHVGLQTTGLPAQLLVTRFNPAAAEGVMCRDTVSVGWDGRLYDCDFNQQLALDMRCVRVLPAAGWERAISRGTQRTENGGLRLWLACRLARPRACMGGVICQALLFGAKPMGLRCDTDRRA